jgi:hypothetical protein
LITQITQNVNSKEPVEKLKNSGICHAELVSASKKINVLRDPETSSR